MKVTEENIEFDHTDDGELNYNAILIHTGSYDGSVQLKEQILESLRIHEDLREYVRDCEKNKAIPKLYRLNKILGLEFK